MALRGFNDKNEGGLVTSETFNLTRSLPSAMRLTCVVD
jgi:hypothetical protein